jgi:putative transposase
LRLLDASRAVVNALLARLWPRLDEFMVERSGPAWKQVVAMTGSPDPHGDRQFRCEAETAGRILRAQAQRKQVFHLIQPLLSDGFIRPKTETRPAGRNRKTITEATLALQNVVEQACNRYCQLHTMMRLFFLKSGEEACFFGLFS